MELLEKHLEDYFMQQEEIEVNGKLIWLHNNQVPCCGYYIDMIGLDEDNNIYVFELKKGIVDGNALSQLLNYMNIVKKITTNWKNDNFKIYGVLIGSGLTDYMQLALNELDNVYFQEYHVQYIAKDSSYSMRIETLNEGITPFENNIGEIKSFIEEEYEIGEWEKQRELNE